ncbi:ABC transporter ATP-binding protein [Myceligenerans pegani]|uniref:ABC transporter ATP-binding protein n=1 Tax=Myceligenerans pegani TaxID=2776917 RepID=A0ABR9MW71_9MICO|nr:ABC transporter ATP-binding protein [Myceligenerans sp. TRM 65318]MBE1875017.1 ABC transporter ATP-binding protein [Myceligenerans sp. TRM 65318]MBE3017288.1 ABC transporter ATP-binding protein [Myceligenerans sp. TRM 65318]
MTTTTTITTPATTDDQPPPSTAPLLELVGVGKTYPAPGRARGRAVLKEVSHGFEAGRMSAIVGPSGSGKTTLLSLAGGLDEPTTGTVRFRGQDLAALGLAPYRRRHAATVFQSANLLTYLNPVQNVTSAMEITGSRRRRRRQHAHDLLDQLGIAPEDRGRSVLQLSGGQQQRVAIARALACDVDVLLADEPTGNLDEATASDIIAILRGLAHDGGKCVVVVTHSREVADASDEVLRLRRGRLART